MFNYSNILLFKNTAVNCKKYSTLLAKLLPVKYCKFTLKSFTVYRAIIETLLNYSEDTFKSQFSAGLFYKDTAGAVDSRVTLNGPNRGLYARAAYTADSREVHLLGLLHADILFSERLLLNSVDVRIELTHASDAFCLMEAEDGTFCLKVLGASLFTKKVTVSPAVCLGHASALEEMRFTLCHASA